MKIFIGKKFLLSIFVVVFSAIILLFYDPELSFIPFMVVGLLFLLMNASSNPADFSYYFLLVVVYSVVNLVYLYFVGVFSIDFLCVFLFSIFVFVSFFKFNNRIENVFYQTDKNLMWKVYLFSMFMSFLLKSGVFFFGGNVFKALNMLFSDVLFFSILGSYFALLVNRKCGFLFLIFLIFLLFFYFFFINFYSSDVSRLSFFIFSLVTFLGFYYRFFSKGKLFLPRWMYYFSVLLTLLFISFLILSSGRFGGDSLIFYSAIQLIDNVRESNDFQPLMLLHNGGGVIIPDVLWLTEKPKMYNPSAWYIENIMGYDPSEYPWGIGVSSFGAAYLYGGYISVFIVFSLYASLAKFINLFSNYSFFIGVSIIFNVKLVFSFVRMDESFLIGPWLFTLPMLFVFLYWFRKRISRSLL